MSLAEIVLAQNQSHKILWKKLNQEDKRLTHWKLWTTENPLHMNLQGANFQRCECGFQRWALVKLQFALCLLLLMILQIYHFPPPLAPPLVNNCCYLLVHLMPALQASCCNILLYFSRHLWTTLDLWMCSQNGIL